MADTHADDIGTIGCCIVDTLNNGSHIARTVALHNSYWHNKCIGVSTGDTYLVIVYGCSNTGTVGTVTIPVANA